MTCGGLPYAKIITRITLTVIAVRKVLVPYWVLYSRIYGTPMMLTKEAVTNPSAAITMTTTNQTELLMHINNR